MRRKIVITGNSKGLAELVGSEAQRRRLLQYLMNCRKQLERLKYLKNK